MASDIESSPGVEGENGSLILERRQRERIEQGNSSVLVAHNRNYVLPLTYASQPNNNVFDVGSQDFGGELDNTEVQFQLSIKSPIAEGLFTEKDTLYAAFTVHSFWQAYNSDVSAPFRETNYEPELIWVTPVPWEIFGGDASLFTLGLSHQSNGRIPPFSRSWNRINTSVIWERWRYVFRFKAWWRVPENKKNNPLDSRGDDNPDIEDYLGNFEFNVAYQKGDQEISAMMRNNLNFDKNRGALQIDWTFPLHRRYRGYVQFFDGYGESLIDYNAHISRISVGILLSDLL